VGGIQLICISVIGSYMAHMYEEVKARPPYIVDQIINPPRPRRSDAASRRSSDNRDALAFLAHVSTPAQEEAPSD